MNKARRGPRRISAVAAALSLLWPFLVLLLGSSAHPEALLPACCRRNGEHHCMLRMTQGGGMDSAASSSSPHLGRVFAQCPYTPASVPNSGNALTWRPTAELTSAPVQTSGAAALRDLCGRKHPQASANFKRGPPVSNLSA